MRLGNIVSVIFLALFVWAFVQANVLLMGACLLGIVNSIVAMDCNDEKNGRH